MEEDQFAIRMGIDEFVVEVLIGVFADGGVRVGGDDCVERERGEFGGDAGRADEFGGGEGARPGRDGEVVLAVGGGDVGDGAAEGGEFGVDGGGEREGGDDEEGAGGEFDCVA